MKDQIDKAITILVEKINKHTPSDELLRITQAILNLANAKEMWKRNGIGC